MPTVKKDIEVEAPVERLYDMWTRYEQFPTFMEHIEEVRRVGPDMTHWVAKAAGQRVEWDARTLAESNRRVAWTAMGESGQSGEVRFTPLGTNRTRVDVTIDYKLDNRLKEAAANVLQVDDRIVADDLKSFKELAEGGGFGSL